MSAPAALLDVATKLTGTVTATWRPTVGEHSMAARFCAPTRDDEERAEPDKVRSAREAQKRAQKMVRRWCAHQRLDRLVTLTLAEATGLEDRERVRRRVARMFAVLRLKYRTIHYVYVLELHPGGHGYHVHCAVNQWIDPVVLRSCWGLGYVDIRRIKTKSRGNLRSNARLAARYIAKYACKAEDEGRLSGRHRYERSQGEPIPEVTIECDSWEAAESWLRSRIKGAIAWEWSSLSSDDWHGPPTLVLWE